MPALQFILGLYSTQIGLTSNNPLPAPARRPGSLPAGPKLSPASHLGALAADPPLEAFELFVDSPAKA